MICFAASISFFAKCSEIYFVAALLTPMSRNVRYPITAKARENNPNEVAPRKATSRGIATTRTRKTHPSVSRLSVALRASKVEEASRVVRAVVEVLGSTFWICKGMIDLRSCGYSAS